MRSQLLEHWDELIEAIGKNPQEPISIAIVGGGASGVELAWRMQSHLHRILHQTQQPIQNLEIHLFQRDNAQYNSWRGCALSVAMPQALRLLYLGNS